MLRSEGTSNVGSSDKILRSVFGRSFASLLKEIEDNCGISTVYCDVEYNRHVRGLRFKGLYGTVNIR